MVLTQDVTPVTHSYASLQFYTQSRPAAKMKHKDDLNNTTKMNHSQVNVSSGNNRNASDNQNGIHHRYHAAERNIAFDRKCGIERKSLDQAQKPTHKSMCEERNIHSGVTLGINNIVTAQHKKTMGFSNGIYPQKDRDFNLIRNYKTVVDLRNGMIPQKKKFIGVYTVTIHFKEKVARSKTPNMAVSDANSLDDDLATTTTEGDGSLDTILRQLEAEKKRMDRRLLQKHHSVPVPLAEPEDFLEDGGNLTEDDVPNVPTSEGVTPDNDVYLDDPGGGENDEGEGDGDVDGGAEEAELDIDLDPTQGATANGPFDVIVDIDHIMDVNGNGTTKSRRWLERKMQELEESNCLEEEEGDNGEDPEADYDIMEFAEMYFNVHVSSTGYTGAISKTVNIVRRRSLSELIPTHEQLRYTKSSTIPTSLVHLHDSENTAVACSIFKDLCKYMKGELKEDLANQVLRSIVSYGIQRVELRDEIYCQILRQCNANTHKEQALRLWIAWCLCVVSFNPSKTLNKYLLSYLRIMPTCPESKIADYASFCLRHLKVPLPGTRKMPPSVSEIEAIRNMQPLVCRIYFLDGKTKAVGIEPNETAKDLLKKVQEKIGLQNLHGWALYESTPDHDRFIRESEFLADIISDWEEKQRAQASIGSPKKVPPHLPSADYGKIIFCKRIYTPVTEVDDDPIEYHLLYAQALHHNVQVDEYSVPQPVALHLAGLQAQVIHGNYEEDKMYRYADVDDYLCQRVIASDSLDWASEIAAAHKKYATGKTETEAKMRYLVLISQFPLYGCVKFFAHYKGLWHFGFEFIVAIGHVNVKLISIQEKTIAYEFGYADIEVFNLDFDHDLLTIELREHVVSKQKSYMFECLDVEDMAALVEQYAPQLATWTQQTHPEPLKKHWKASESDWIRLFDKIVDHRKVLVHSGLVNRPPDQGMGLLKCALKKLSGRGGCGLEGREDDIDLKGTYWTHQKTPFKTSLMTFESHELDDISVRMFNSTLVYTGIESVAVLEDMDLITVVQTLITKCMESDDLCNEFYLQLIKQTTDTPADPNNKAVLRYWHLMTMATCVMLPPNGLILSYLKLHLKRYALQEYTEEGKYASFCIKSIFRTYESKGRKHPPSYKEVVFVTKRQSLEVLMNLPDGQQIQIEFDSASTASEVLQQVKARVGMRLDADGFGIYEACGEKTESYMPPDEKLCDSLYRWEKWAQSNQTVNKDLIYSFKKRIFVEPFTNPKDPIEVDMLYHQSVTEVFEEKIPLTKPDAIQLCALRAQTEFGDHGYANNFDYTSVMRILPRHLRDLINVADISDVHKTLVGMTPIASNIAFLDVLKHWPLYGATFFNVTQSYSDTLPKWIWLAISQIGIHIMECRGQHVYASYTHKDIVQCSPTIKNLILVIGSSSKGPKLIFNTAEASQIVQLILDYQEVVLGKIESCTSVVVPEKPSKSTKKKRTERTEHRTTIHANNEQETKL